MDKSVQTEEDHLGDFFLPDDEILRMYEQEFGGNLPIQQCAYGTAESIYQQLSQLVLIVSISRITKILPLPSFLKDILNIGFGIYVVRINVPRRPSLSTVLLIALSLTLFSRVLKSRSKGVLVTAVGILTIVLLELYVQEVAVVRGVLMVLVMKMSSLAFEFSRRKSPPFLETVSFLLDPSTVIFGPFVGFENWQISKEFVSVEKETRSLLFGVFSFLAALICVVYSSCHSELVQVNPLTADYLTAQSFRFSHYFICLFSQGLWALAGGSGYVTNPLPIEFPRSLVDVVVEWNVPMHKYLRQYIFGFAKKYYGKGAAVFFTFLVSSLLHGLNFQLSAVLVSLGFLCYGENIVRNRLSTRLSSCCRSRTCVDCNHTRKSTNPVTLAVNLLFSLLSIYHLIYLGMPFDGQSSPEHAIQTWSRHHFASHLISLLYIFLSKTI